jgi:hypothetical protein
MKRKAKLPFDPKVFLSKVNGGRTISNYWKDQIVYRQGDPADSCFLHSERQRQETVVSEAREGKPWSHFREPAISLGKGA